MSDETANLDRLIERLRKSPSTPPKMAEAVIYAGHTLRDCKTIAEAIFGEDQVTPGIVLAVYDRLNQKRIDLVDEENAELKSNKPAK